MDNYLQYGKVVAEGTGYEIGVSYAKQLEQNELLRKINLLPKEKEVVGVAFQERQKLLSEVCPGIEEEIAGVADTMKLSPGRLGIFRECSGVVGKCSQIAALPPITANGHLYVGRSYEFTFEDELCFCVTRREGKPRQAGFTLMLFGRTDGMNENGLCVTMSTCSFLQPASGKGVWFPIVLRGLLDRCSTVEEASYLLKQFPICSNDNYLIADAAGNARIAEICCLDGERHVSFRDAEDMLVATNHYQNPDMLEFDKHRGRHSVRRWRTACETLERNRGRVDENVMKTLLEKRMPEGVSCPYYSDGLGTLRSMVFDVTAGALQVAYGMPRREGWERVALDAPCENRTFEVPVHDEYAENPQEFWKFLPPGCLDE